MVNISLEFDPAGKSEGATYHIFNDMNPVVFLVST